MKKLITVLFAIALLFTFSCKTDLEKSIKNETEITKTDVTLYWDNPQDIIFGTELSETELNATADENGIFEYTPSSGTVLIVGTHDLTVNFIPTDTVLYNTATKTVTINVLEEIIKTDVTITWDNPEDIYYGTPLSETELNATADESGTFEYTPSSGTVLSVGTHDLTVNFTPTDTVYYNTATKTVTINVLDLNIGDNFQGGKIAYIFQAGDPGYIPGEIHGLIASNENLNLSDGTTWSNGNNFITGATGTVLGTGLSNTEEIVSDYGEGDYAASLCVEYVSDGYDDWFLPSIGELQKINENQPQSLVTMIGLYWSSTEALDDIHGVDEAWMMGFITVNPGEQKLASKDANQWNQYNLLVRAVRYF